jgi:hypothetical protein
MNAMESKPLNKSLYCDTPLITWLNSFVQCKLSVTITFGMGRGSETVHPCERTVEEIIRKGIKRLNTLCYRNLVKRRGYSIGAVTVIEGKGPFDRIHAHIGFEPPVNMSLSKFSNLVGVAFKPSKWIEQRPYMKKCWSQHWINYMLKFGQDALVPSCCIATKHPIA